MDWIDFFELLFFFAITFLLARPLGTYMAKIFQGKKTKIHFLFSWMENGCYKVTGIDPNLEMDWIEYAKGLFFFNFLGFIAIFAIQLLQGYLPLNPENLSAVPLLLAFNTAISSITNSNWQSYAGETTLSYFTQMVGLTSQNFLSASNGMAVLLVLIRGLKRKMTLKLGNYWVDLVRSIVYLFLPLSILLTFILIAQGVIQTFSPSIEITTLETSTQIIPLGPVGSQLSIKQLGSNGGGFFNANSAHPFENPTGFSNFLEMIAIILIPAASVYMYGLLIESRKQATVLISVMLSLLVFGIAVSMYSGYVYNPVVDAYPLLEGKETRIGQEDSHLWTSLTTATSNGSFNCTLTSLSPISGGIALFNIEIGEVIFGGVGVGLCRSMLMFTLLTAFISGLMVGRTPEYLGKKIEQREMQLIAFAVLTPIILCLVGSGIACILPEGLVSLNNHGPHGLTEIIYAFASCAGNNGSSFTGLDTNTDFYNLTLGSVMLIGRASIILPTLAIAGSLAKKNTSPPSIGTLSTDSILFAILLISVIWIMGALSFFPALVLGPILEELLMQAGQAF